MRALILRNFGIVRSMGALELNSIVGELIGGTMLIIKMGCIVIELIKIIERYFCIVFSKRDSQ